MEELLTAEDLSKMFRVRKKTIYCWVSRRQIPFVKLPGDTTRFHPSAIQTWLAKREAKGKGLSRGCYLEPA